MRVTRTARVGMLSAALMVVAVAGCSSNPAPSTSTTVPETHVAPQTTPSLSPPSPSPTPTPSPPSASSGSATVTDLDGWSWKVSFSSARTVVSIDTAHGAPGNVILTADFSGTVSATSATPGKVAPRLQLSMLPIFAADPCAPVTSYGYCNTRTLTTPSGTVYWRLDGLNRWGILGNGSLWGSPASDEIGWSSSAQLSDPDPALPDVRIRNWELAQNEATTLRDALESPVGWIVLGNDSSQDGNFSCAAEWTEDWGSTTKSLCILLTSDNLR